MISNSRHFEFRCGYPIRKIETLHTFDWICAMYDAANEIKPHLYHSRMCIYRKYMRIGNGPGTLCAATQWARSEIYKFLAHKHDGTTSIVGRSQMSCRQTSATDGKTCLRFHVIVIVAHQNNDSIIISLNRLNARVRRKRGKSNFFLPSALVTYLHNFSLSGRQIASSSAICHCRRRQPKWVVARRLRASHRAIINDNLNRTHLFIRTINEKW